MSLHSLNIHHLPAYAEWQEGRARQQTEKRTGLWLLVLTLYQSGHVTLNISPSSCQMMEMAWVSFRVLTDQCAHSLCVSRN